MAHFQGIFERRQNQMSHEWRLTGFRELWHTKWLIIGFGNIGQEIAKRVRAFDCQVIGVRRTTDDHPLADSIITLEEIFEFLPQADVVVLACALNKETRGFANMDFFQKMKKQAIFVNIARGQLVVQKDLFEALNNGILAHAVLDVFDPEPLEPASPLWDRENVIISPHSSNAGSGTRIRGDRLFLDNLRCFTKGQPLINEADPDLI